MSIFWVQGAEGSAGWPQDRRGAGVEGRGGSFSCCVVRWGLKWEGHIERSRTKMEQLLGVLGRAGSVLGRCLLHSIGLVLAHLQCCLMVWGNFATDRNKTQGDALLRLQKRFVGLMAGKRGWYPADPLFARFGVLKVGDLY